MLGCAFSVGVTYICCLMADLTCLELRAAPECDGVGSFLSI
jgi:hypothetical protein